MSLFKLGLIQLDIKLGKIKENSAQARKLIAEAKDKGADMVLLPELWATGYDVINLADYAYPLGEGLFSDTAEIARENQLYIAGSLISRDKEKLKNTASLYSPQGRLIGSYSKTHLFPLMNEDEYFVPGEALSTAGTPLGKIGFAICFDLRFPELFRSYALAAADLILLPAEWPGDRIAHFELLLKARAVENQYFVAGVNAVGKIGKFYFPGCSQIIAPDGEVLARLGDSPGVAVAEIDLERINRVRESLPVLNNRRPDIYQL
jgi:omega-amidase